MENTKILIVEDDTILALSLRRTLSKWGYSAEIAPSGEDAIERIHEDKIDLVLMDIQLGGEMDGIESAGRIRSEIGIPIIYLTAHSDKAFVHRAKETGPYSYLVKPVQDDALRAGIELALYKSRLDRQLRESEERYRSLVSQSLDGIVSFDVNTKKIEEANQAFVRLLGYPVEEVRELTVYDIFVDSEESIDSDIDRISKEGQALLGEKCCRGRGGLLIDVEVSGALVVYSGHTLGCITIRDISERKRMAEMQRLLDARIHYAQKMESLHRMAGALAHHFNNALHVMLGNLELIRMELPDESDAQEYMDDLGTVCGQARDLVKQLLGSMGFVSLNPVPLDLSGVLDEMRDYLESMAPKRVALQFDLARELPAIDVDPVHVHQIIVNVYQNAIEAVGDQSGSVVFRTDVRDVDRHFLDEPHLPSDLSGGRYVVFTVTDTGCGMNEAVKSKIFDPFFSTKFTGRGLGLTAVLMILLKHKGFIKVYSIPGEGTTIMAGFPVGP